MDKYKYRKTKDMSRIFVKAEQLKHFIKGVLLKAKVRDDVAEHVARGLTQTSIRGVDSHGVRLLGHYLRALKGGRINPNPKYKFKKTSLSTGTLDADHTFGHASGMEAAKKAVQLAKKAGTGHIAVYNSTHFGAAAYYALEIARCDMLGMAFTNTDALVKTYAGKRPFLGNNPICFTAPSNGEEPFCLDMATSTVTFNKIMQFKEQGLSLPKGVGADKNGLETTKPGDVTTLLPIGGYKGYGLSMFVEILCSLLTGMPYGPHIPKMFEASMDKKRLLGHFITAIKIDCFQDTDMFKRRLSLMMNELRKEPRLDKKNPIQVAGDPEKKYATERKKTGIPLTKNEYKMLKEISKSYKVDLKLKRDLSNAGT